MESVFERPPTPRQALGVGLPPSPPNAALARGGWLSHACGVALLVAIGALRCLNAPPMLVFSDTAPPLFGAGVTGACGAFKPLGRFRRGPELQTREAWREAVGLGARS